MFRRDASLICLGFWGLLVTGCTLNDPLTRVQPNQGQRGDAAPDAAGDLGEGDGGKSETIDSGSSSDPDRPTTACDDGEARACGPETEDGICNLGIRVCENGAWGDCVDAVYPAPRDCTSSADNDCDGLPDSDPGGPCVCTPGATEACDEHPGLDGRGPCRAGVRTCVASPDRLSSDWGPCEGAVGPAAADSCSVDGDDSDCSGLPNDGCVCVEGKMYRCGPGTDVGICAYGTATCTDGSIESCVGAVLPALRDCGAPPEVDNDCDGIPDNTLDGACTCAVGTTRPCDTHPGLDGIGECRPGTQTCVFGPTRETTLFGPCVGAVGRADRNCASALDHDCDGVPDNTVDAACTCDATVGGPQLCPAVPGQRPPCHPGLRQCVLGPGNRTSAFSSCLGAVGPQPADSCLVEGDDATCDGVPNGGCQCVTARGNLDCATRPAASVCVAPGVCAPCTAAADCALVTGSNVCSAGVCVECTAADTRACAADEICQNQACVPAPVAVTDICGACTSDLACGPNARCVTQRLGSGSFCFPIPVAGACTSPPFSTLTAATSAAGAAVEVCLPRATTCQALADYDTKLCGAVGGVGDHAACGLAGVDDGICVLTPAAGATGRCSVPCAPAGADCPRGACIDGACEVTPAATAP